MKPTRPGVLVGLFIVFAMLTWALRKSLYSDLPTVPWTAIPTVLLLAIGEFYSGWMTKARIERKPDTKPVEPLAVARLAALAKASAYGGAIFAGIFAGFALHTAAAAGPGRAPPRLPHHGGSFVVCVLLVCAALYPGARCKVPRTPTRKIARTGPKNAPGVVRPGDASCVPPARLRASAERLRRPLRRRLLDASRPFCGRTA